MFIFQLALHFKRTVRRKPVIQSTRTEDVVLFDGLCNLCAHCVRFILRHETAPRLRFTPLQSRAGARLLREHGIDAEEVQTFVLITNGRAYVRSDAAIQVSHQFRGAWRLLGAVKLIPRPIRDWGYDLVARNRYRWFGRFEACMVPSPALRSRFFEE